MLSFFECTAIDLVVSPCFKCPSRVEKYWWPYVLRWRAAIEDERLALNEIFH